MINTFIFDIDGTIISSNKAYYDSLLFALKEHHIDMPIGFDIEDYCNLTAKDALAKIGITDIANVLKTWSYLFNKMCENAPYFDGILEAIQELNAMGNTIAIVTSRDNNAIRSIYNSNCLANLIKLWVTAEKTKKHKPDPEPILYAINRLKVQPNKCVYIGDSINDYLASTQAGVTFIAAAWNKNAINLPGICLYHPRELIKLCDSTI